MSGDIGKIDDDASCTSPAEEGDHVNSVARMSPTGDRGDNEVHP